MKHKTSLIAAIVLVIAGCVLRFAMPGHDFLGYTLWGIAAKYLGSGGRYGEIVALNGLKSNVIVTGQKLNIPN